MRQLGSGHPPLHRFRVGLEFALSGHRDVDGMFEHHAAIARTLAAQLGLSEDVLRRSARPTRRGTAAVGLASSKVSEFQSRHGSRS